jgi:ABC-type sugar transport system ATPase subunit
MRLRLSDVTIRRGALTFGRFDFVVEGGEKVVLTGPNGSGKSTLLAAIAGLLPIAGGEIELGDRRLAGAGSHVAPHDRDVAILLQDLGLWPHLTIRRQCELVGRSSFALRSEREARLRELAECLDVTALLDRAPATLSGGEAQRCALARTLMHRASCLLLDEPTSRQAAAGAQRIEQLLDLELARGAVVLMAAHGAAAGTRVYSLAAE